MTQNAKHLIRHLLYLAPFVLAMAAHGDVVLRCNPTGMSQGIFSQPQENPAAEVLRMLPELNVKAPDGSLRLTFGSGRTLVSEVANGRLSRFIAIDDDNGKRRVYLPVLDGEIHGKAKIYDKNGALQKTLLYRHNEIVPQ